MDKRQELHFTQVFRVAKKAGIVPADRKMDFVGFGTMNGKDGKPFKTREGGVMRLENLIADIDEAAYNRIMENRTVSEDEAKTTAEIVGLAALNTAISLTRPQRTMSSISTDLLPLREIQVRMFSTRSRGSTPS